MQKFTIQPNKHSGNGLKEKPETDTNNKSTMGRSDPWVIWKVCRGDTRGDILGQMCKSEPQAAASQ